ncbi:hypothetical protein BV22DRAFT_1041788 [Leucogyrophana mollusca]|uniref:Uncharacterized protein n=1 Tax=Leucogyrophana mollusca TaxID=85980 RepID=A0ACB8AY14_9AGAM|nr:hypothetical protein BV22DRAFT_1041788 [Leucogyrophana mollusca]
MSFGLNSLGFMFSCSPPPLPLVRQHGVGAKDTRDRRPHTATAKYVHLPRQHRSTLRGAGRASCAR